MSDVNEQQPSIAAELPPLERPKILLQDEPKHMGAVGYFAKTVNGTDQIGMFGFASAQFIPLKWNEQGRCDGGVTGPMSFHAPDDDGNCSCGKLDPNPVYGRMCENGFGDQRLLRISSPVISLLPHGYISYIESHDKDADDLFVVSHWNVEARTLQELFKLMFEWRDARNYLDVESAPAITADLLLAELDMPTELEEWVRTEVPDQFVVKFLNDDQDARVRTLPPEMTNEFSYWLHDKIVDSPVGYGFPVSINQ